MGGPGNVVALVVFIASMYGLGFLELNFRLQGLRFIEFFTTSA